MALRLRLSNRLAGMLYVADLNPAGQETIVLLHALGEDSSFYTEQGDIPSLLAHYRFLIPDLPGAGHSRTTPFTTFSKAAELVHELIAEYAHSKPVHLAGFDTGGSVALTLAELYPASVSSCLAIGVDSEEVNVPSPFIWRAFASILAANAAVVLSPLRLFPSPKLAHSSFYAMLSLPTDRDRIKRRVRQLTYRRMRDTALALKDFRLRPLQPRTLLLAAGSALAVQTAQLRNMLFHTSILQQGNRRSGCAAKVWGIDEQPMASQRFAAVMAVWVKGEGQIQGWVGDKQLPGLLTRP